MLCYFCCCLFFFCFFFFCKAAASQAIKYLLGVIGYDGLPRATEPSFVLLEMEAGEVQWLKVRELPEDPSSPRTHLMRSVLSLWLGRTATILDPKRMPYIY